MHAQAIDDAFPGTEIEPELLPLIREFITLSDRGHIALPLPQKISKIQFVAHKELLRTLKSKDIVMAVTLVYPESNDAVILLSEKLRSSAVELKILLFHELLHAAGFDHPTSICHWAQTGCGIMGQSPYPYRRLSADHAEFVIESSFKPSYLAKLPRLDF